jgi:PAS domain S-box-containing protein
VAIVEGKKLPNVFERAEDRDIPPRLRQIYTVAFEAMADGVVVQEADGQIVACNPAAEQILGLTADQMQGRSSIDPRWQAIRTDGTPFPGEEHPAMVSLRTGEPQERVLMGIQKPDGTRTWIRVTTRLLHGDAGRIDGVVATFQDISTERAAQQMLERSNALTRSLFDSYPFGAIVCFDHDLRYYLVGGRGLEEVGLDPEEMHGKTVHEVFPEAVCARIVPQYRRALNGAITTQVVEYAERVYQTAAGPIHGDDGAIVGGIVITQDITEQVAAERQLRQKEQQYRMVAEHTQDLVALHAADSRYLWVSPSVTQILGYAPDDLIGARPYSFIHPEDKRRAKRWALRRLKTGQDQGSLTFRFRRADGCYVWLESLARPIYDDAGRIQHFQTSSRDITQQKEYQQQLIQARHEAEEMSRLKSTFLANMSHEIRTPLTSIIGFAEILGDEVGAPHREPARLIQQSGRRLLRTLDGVLDLAQLESGSISVRRRALDGAAYLHDLVHQFQVRADRKGIALCTDVPDVPVQMDTDQNLLDRILSNLLSNAIKFTHEGSVVARLREADDHVTFEVEDTGIGIAPDFVPHLFKEFEQESSGIARNYEGVGLGLKLVKSATDLLGGTITVESEKGHGTWFAVQLPKAAD